MNESLLVTIATNRQKLLDIALAFEAGKALDDEKLELLEDLLADELATRGFESDGSISAYGVLIEGSIDRVVQRRKSFWVP